MSPDLGISALRGVGSTWCVCLTDVDLATFPPLVCLRFLNHNYHAVLTHGDVLCGKVLVRVEPMLVGYCKLADLSRPKKPSVMAALSIK